MPLGAKGEKSGNPSSIASLEIQPGGLPRRPAPVVRPPEGGAGRRLLKDLGWKPEVRTQQNLE